MKRNGGRVGAKYGPKSFREYILCILSSLTKMVGTMYNPEYDIDCSKVKISDFGDIDEKLELEEAHTALTKSVESIIKKGGIPFVVGGGNVFNFDLI